MSWLDGNKMRSTEQDAQREQAERVAMRQRDADRKAAQEAAQAQAEADRIAAQNAEIERRLFAAYPFGPERWEQDKEQILAAERHRLTLATEQRARQRNAANYQ